MVSFLFRRELGEIDALLQNVSHELLQLVDATGAVHQNEHVSVDHLVVIIENALLKNAEAFGAVERNPQIHAGFVIFELGATGNNAIHGHIQGSAEIKGDVGNGRKAV